MKPADDGVVFLKSYDKTYFRHFLIPLNPEGLGIYRSAPSNRSFSIMIGSEEVEYMTMGKSLKSSDALISSNTSIPEYFGMLMICIK